MTTSGEYGDGEPVVRDRRRIDPTTGEVREPAEQAGPATGSVADAAAEIDEHLLSLTDALSERTADLQRLKAEYDNYRRRVDRDRVAVGEEALARVLSELLPVLDAVARAREHGELEGGFRSVGEGLETACTRLGLVTFGEVGDDFDPMVHEALMHSYSSEVSAATCVAILQPGYRVGERILRPARVSVAEPSDDGPTEAPDESS